MTLGEGVKGVKEEGAPTPTALAVLCGTHLLMALPWLLIWQPSMQLEVSPAAGSQKGGGPSGLVFAHKPTKAQPQSPDQRFSYPSAHLADHHATSGAGPRNTTCGLDTNLQPCGLEP